MHFCPPSQCPWCIVTHMWCASCGGIDWWRRPSAMLRMRLRLSPADSPSTMYAYRPPVANTLGLTHACAAYVSRTSLVFAPLRPTCFASSAVSGRSHASVLESGVGAIPAGARSTCRYSLLIASARSLGAPPPRYPTSSSSPMLSSSPPLSSSSSLASSVATWHLVPPTRSARRGLVSPVGAIRPMPGSSLYTSAGTVTSARFAVR